MKLIVCHSGATISVRITSNSARLGRHVCDVHTGACVMCPQVGMCLLCGGFCHKAGLREPHDTAGAPRYSWSPAIQLEPGVAAGVRRYCWSPAVQLESSGTAGVQRYCCGPAVLLGSSGTAEPSRTAGARRYSRRPAVQRETRGTAGAWPYNGSLT